MKSKDEINHIKLIDNKIKHHFSETKRNKQSGYSLNKDISNYESDSSSHQCSQNGIKSSRKFEQKMRLQEINQKSILNLQNDIEQEVSMLLKSHYMLHLNIQTPAKSVNLFNQEEKEIYLSYFVEMKESVVKRIEETNKNMEQLNKLQTSLYESTLMKQSTLSPQPDMNNSPLNLEDCKRHNIIFSSAIKGMQGFINEFLLYIDNYNQIFPHKIKSTFDNNNSQPVSFSSIEHDFIIIESTNEITSDHSTSYSSLHIKQPLLSQNQRQDQYNLITNLLIHNNNKINNNNIDNNKVYEKQSLVNEYEKVNINEAKRIEYVQELSKKSKSNTKLDLKQSDKLQQDQRIEVNQFLTRNKSQLELSHYNVDQKQKLEQKKQKILRLSSSIASNSNQNNHTKNNNNQQISKSKVQKQYGNQIQKQAEQIIIKPYYEEQYERFNNLNLIFMQIHEKLDVILEEFEQIIYHVRTYLMNFCFDRNQSDNRMSDTHSACAQQLDKCILFFDQSQCYEEQINFIEDQLLHFSNSQDDNLSHTLQNNLTKKLKRSKSIIYSQNQAENNMRDDCFNQQHKKINYNSKIIKACQQNQQNESCEERQQNSLVEQRSSSQKDKYSYINSLKLFYQPHSKVIQHKQSLQDIIQNSIDFQNQFLQDSQQFYTAIRSCMSKNSCHINELMKNKQEIYKIFKKC